MEGGFPYGDVIVIGAIAAFIILRYRAMLGEPRGRDENDVRESQVQRAAEQERVIQLPVTRAIVPEKKEEDLVRTYGSLAETFTAMRAVDRDFAPDEFMNGARAAYEMVITAFSKRDRETLKMLLSDAMYKSFDLSLTDAERDKRFNDTTLLAITDSSIKDAKITGSLAKITVAFVSEQTHLIRDENGIILEGDASERNVVEDEWVFTRTLSNPNPNWTIIET